MAAGPVERELVEICNFDGSKYKTRQNYLAALARAIEKIPGEDFDNLTDDAADWYNAAADAISEKKEIDDFEAEESEKAEPNTGETEVASADEGEDIPEFLRRDAEPVPETQVALDTKEPETGAAKSADDKAEKAPKKGKNASPSHKTQDYSQVTGEKDRWGFIKGTKTAKVVEMYERGTTAKEIMEVVGGRFYNMLAQLQKGGHKVEKTAEGLWKVTHKDDLK